MQYIKEDETKRFAKNSRKEGCFHALGGLNALAKAPALVIAEGFATAASISQELGFATISAFDAGNLEPVARALQEQFPDKPIITMGDDDKHLEINQGINPGRSKALDAAKAVNGIALFPIFAPGEQAGDPKSFSDFNDLASKSVLGSEGVKRQIKPIVDKIIQKKGNVYYRAERNQNDQASTQHVDVIKSYYPKGSLQRILWRIIESHENSIFILVRLPLLSFWTMPYFCLFLLITTLFM